MNNKLNQYAKLAIRTGVNVQNGQTLLIQAKAEHVEFVRLCVNEAYEAGAKKVIVKFNDDHISKMHYEHQDIETLSDIPQWNVDEYDDYISKDFCILSIYAPSPGILKDIDGEKIAAASKASGEALKNYREYMMANRGQWSLVSLPTKEWANVVFPELDDEKGQEKLLESILYTVRINGEDDPVALWDAHNKVQQDHLHH